MKTWFWTAFPLLVCAVTACQQSTTSSEVVWQKGSTPPPALFSSDQFSRSERSMLVAGEIVRFSKQRWGPAQIEGGSLQRIENAHGELLYGKAQFQLSPDSLPSLSLEKLEELYQKRFLFLEIGKNVIFSEKTFSILSEPDLILLEQGKRLVPTYAVDLLNKSKNIVERIWSTPDYVILKREQISSSFDAQAWLFTVSEHSSLQEVLMKNLLEGSSLEAKTHLVISNSNQNASPVNAPWKFALDDPRFDQVQAFYFLQQGFDFFANELNFTLPIAVEARTSMGFPQKTNAAFTYNGQIRLGEGDGVNYGSMARDASIVIHELGHVLVDTVAHLSTQGEAGSLNEAFADFFAAACLNNPKMGQQAYLPGPFKRNLEDLITFDQQDGGLYHDSQIVSGTLWEIRSKIGAHKAQLLALRTLSRLGPATQLKAFSISLKAAMTDFLTVDEIKNVNQILEKRKWAL